jgi:hypothetical protein
LSIHWLWLDVSRVDHGLIVHWLLHHGLIVHGLIVHGLIVHGLIIHGLGHTIGRLLGRRVVHDDGSSSVVFVGIVNLTKSQVRGGLLLFPPDDKSNYDDKPDDTTDNTTGNGPSNTSGRTPIGSIVVSILK